MTDVEAAGGAGAGAGDGGQDGSPAPAPGERAPALRRGRGRRGRPADRPARGPVTAAAFGPGRVNLVGEHTDYNDGLCLPFAIELGITVRARPSLDGMMRVHAVDIGSHDVFPAVDPPRAEGWRSFGRGVVALLTEAGYPVRPARLTVTGTLPRGAGLSSSAALEVALALALLAHSGHAEPDRRRLARLLSRVENEWVGARTGLLDQVASLFGRPGHVLCLDIQALAADGAGGRVTGTDGRPAQDGPCATDGSSGGHQVGHGSATGSGASAGEGSCGGLSSGGTSSGEPASDEDAPAPATRPSPATRAVPRPPGRWPVVRSSAASDAVAEPTPGVEPVRLDLGRWRLVTVDSGARHTIATSGYNDRRAECARACDLLGIGSLRDAGPDAPDRLPDPLARRVRHVLAENERVRDAVAALRAGDLAELGRVLDASHASLRDLYEVSAPEVEETVTRLRSAGAVGARMVGGGFGGSVLALFPPGRRPPADAVRVGPGGPGHLLRR